MKFIKRISKNKFGQKLLGCLVFIITSFTYKSISWKLLKKKNSYYYSKKEPIIFCTWHNRLYLGPYLLPTKKLTINALQSSHSDGMMTDILFKLINMKIIYGSSKKKGVSAFIKMIKAVENGESVAITPDGPKGPKEIVKEGIIKLSQTTGAPIVPLFWKVKNYKKLNSWDNFIIPFPFSKGVYIFGKPIHIKRKVTEKKLFQIKMLIQKEFEKLTKEVENYNFNKKKLIK
tara:strand:- start:83 stop:775 length:693 start_codon:yes stop_codon:yes gene_type:complete